MDHSESMPWDNYPHQMGHSESRHRDDYRHQMGHSESKHWVLLAAGSKGWDNYRHQANVCGAYQMIHSNGIPDETIVVMMYDDIAYNEMNPYKGEIINEPDGPNVYPGVPKDYTGEDVSVGNFLAVLRGDEDGVKGGTRKVLKSGMNDTIFVFLSDHGGAGVFFFPHGNPLFACELVETIQQMAECGHFAKMVIYIESCYSGSMIEDLPENVQVYGVSASNPDENHFVFYKDSFRHAYLSGEFTKFWLDHSKKCNPTTTFEEQFNFLRSHVHKSTPCQYGNKALKDLCISEFLGSPDPKTQADFAERLSTSRPTDLTASHDVPLEILRDRIKRERDPEKLAALIEKHEKHQSARAVLERKVQAIVNHVDATRASGASMMEFSGTRLRKMKAVSEHFIQTFSHLHVDQDDPFILSHLHVFVRLIDSGVSVSRINDAITAHRV